MPLRYRRKKMALLYRVTAKPVKIQLEKEVHMLELL